MENPTYHLEGIVKNRDEMQDFSGPLSLILMLLSKNKIEIRDLRISEILEQYLVFMDKMQEMDLDIVSEFVQMASHLVYIKTRTLLAGEDQISELEELMSSLEQLKCHDYYMRVKAVTQDLSRAYERGVLLFSKEPEPVKLAQDKAYRYSHEPIDLITALASVFSRSGKAVPSEVLASHMPQRIVYGVFEKSAQLIELFRKGQIRTLRELFSNSKSRSELVATFISVLELCSSGNLYIHESEGEIALSFDDSVPIKLRGAISDDP